MDEIGTPFCVTIHHQTLEDDTATLRERDSMSQSRAKLFGNSRETPSVKG